jgi:hypothetical protein
VPDGSPSQNMVPFQTAYPMIAALIYCILAGNTAFVCLAFVSSHTFLSSVLYSLFCECTLLARDLLADSCTILQAFAFRCELE